MTGCTNGERDEGKPQGFRPISRTIPFDRAGMMQAMLREVDEGRLTVGSPQWVLCFPTNPTRKQVEIEIERLIDEVTDRPVSIEEVVSDPRQVAAFEM